MLNRIHIKGYKSLADLELNLGPFCVLFGPNAAGKSNFLDALQLMGRLIQSRTLKDAFSPPYRGTPLESFTFPTEGLKGLLTKNNARFCMEVDVALSESTMTRVDADIQEMRQSGPAKVQEERAEYLTEKPSKKTRYVKEKYLRYRVEIEVLPRSGILRVADEYLAALTAQGELKASRNPFLEKMDNKLHLRMEGQAHPTYHDLHLDHTLISTPLYAPHYPHIAALKHELSHWNIFYFEPRERMRNTNPVKEVTHIGLMGEELAAFLNTLKATNEKQLRAVAKALHAIVPSVTDIDVDVNDLGEVELRLMEGAATIPARVVSEGTLRVLGLLSLSSAQEPISLIGFEEPENGVHPRRIRLIAELLKTQAEKGDSQLIVTTHSPILPDLLSDDCLYVCTRRDGTTAIKPFSFWGDLGRSHAIDDALDELPQAEKVPVSQRIMRGDFDV